MSGFALKSHGGCLKTRKGLIQQVQVVFDEKSSDKSTIRFLSMLKQTVQSSKTIRPGKRAFDLPALACVTALHAVFGGTATRHSDMIFTIRNNWNNAPMTEGLSKRFAVIPFIES